MVVIIALACCLALANAIEPSALELQRNIVTNVDDLRLDEVPKTPNFLRLLRNGPMVMSQGCLVKDRFSTVDELKGIKPVKEVRGRVIGGPFGLAEAVRAAGRAVIQRIFPRIGFPGEKIN